MLIPVWNPETADLEKTYLSNPYSVGTQLILVKNNDEFAQNDRIMIGEQGQESTEIVTVTSVLTDGNTINTGATLFAHNQDDPVYRLRFDQIKFYRSTTTSTGTYSVINTANIDVDGANLQTTYDDVTGLATYFYKFTFYHSISTVESAYSDIIGGSGWRREQVGKIIDEFLQEIGDQQEQRVTRGELLGYMNDVNDDLQDAQAKPYDFLHARTTLDRTINQNYINFPVDSNGKQVMWKFDYMDYNYVDSTTNPVTNTTYTLDVIPETEFRNIYSDNTISATTVGDQFQVMCLDTSVNRFRLDRPAKTTSAGVFYLHYWAYFTPLVSEGQVIQTPTPKIYKLYMKAMYWGKRAIADITMQAEAGLWDQKYQAEIVKYSKIDRKDAGTPRRFHPPNKNLTNNRYWR